MPNEHYDENLAQTIARGPVAGAKAIETAQGQLKTLLEDAKESEEFAAARVAVTDLEKQVGDTKKKLAAREAELSKPKAEAPAVEGAPATPKRTAQETRALIEADQQRNDLSNAVKELEAELADARDQATADDFPLAPPVSAENGADYGSRARYQAVHQFHRVHSSIRHLFG